MLRSVKRTIIIAVGLFAYFSGSVAAQVTIAPTALFIDEQSRFGTFLVINGSNQSQEVALTFEFGYPATDEEGNAFMNYDDPDAESRYSMADWVRGFPRNFTLEPGQRQTVRLTVRPPGDIPDGMYWTRIKTTSNPVVPDVDAEVAEGVQAQIVFRFEQVTAGFYKKGSTTTGVRFVNDLSVEKEDDMLVVKAPVERTGNAPFLGSMFLTIRDANGSVVHEERRSTTVYLDAVRRLEVNADQLEPGSYSAEVRFESQRPDISSSDIVRAETVSGSTSFTLP
ncbi:hypothetical protein QLX67_07880 [Balneolaceae bacterium ANBcel3]|nr:hypothetical protein [Balneolaceae bacterium ANBcel3]